MDGWMDDVGVGDLFLSHAICLQEREPFKDSGVEIGRASVQEWVEGCLVGGGRKSRDSHSGEAGIPCASKKSCWVVRGCLAREGPFSSILVSWRNEGGKGIYMVPGWKETGLFPRQTSMFHISGQAENLFECLMETIEMSVGKGKESSFLQFKKITRSLKYLLITYPCYRLECHAWAFNLQNPSGSGPQWSLLALLQTQWCNVGISTQQIYFLAFGTQICIFLWDYQGNFFFQINHSAKHIHVLTTPHPILFFQQVNIWWLQL